MGYILADRFWKVVIVAFVVGLYFLGYAIISGQPANRDVPILPMRGVALSSLEASPHVEWKLSPEMTTPEEVLKFVNSRELHSFQVLTDVHQGGWHFHVIYE
ncbi:MAG TPA: hypothetical protein ACFYED_07305 [Candidatus Tripitaka californicus]|uniref:hypothetical protein n=1 Tax=Candidatus Tripitaka californicus TaxID=3367616 RepID=UPI0040295B09|nr:hypothetical protein [Planctomycetota bacterium]